MSVIEYSSARSFNNEVKNNGLIWPKYPPILIHNEEYFGSSVCYEASPFINQTFELLYVFNQSKTILQSSVAIPQSDYVNIKTQNPRS